MFTPFYERLRRPFIGAYWIAVITYNWKVWTALFFYDELVNGKDKIEYIAEQLSWQSIFLYPVAIALLFIYLGALLDWSVFYYQEWVRSQKRLSREEFERERMVHSETFQRVQQESDRLKKQFIRAETEITDLKREMEELHDYSNKYKELHLEPNEHYFIGKWDIIQPQLSALELIIKKNLLTLRFKDGIDNNLSKKDPFITRDIHELIRTNSEVFVVFNMQQNNTAETLKLVFPQILDADNLTQLFNSRLPIWRIPIKHIHTEDFAVNNQENGTQVVFRRQSTWNSTMHLWMGDAKEFPIPISTFPK